MKIQIILCLEKRRLCFLGLGRWEARGCEIWLRWQDTSRGTQFKRWDVSVPSNMSSVCAAGPGWGLIFLQKGRLTCWCRQGMPPSHVPRLLHFSRPILDGGFGLSVLQLPAKWEQGLLPTSQGTVKINIWIFRYYCNGDQIIHWHEFILYNISMERNSPACL